jgi:hypothetical protein
MSRARWARPHSWRDARPERREPVRANGLCGGSAARFPLRLAASSSEAAFPFETSRYVRSWASTGPAANAETTALSTWFERTLEPRQRVMNGRGQCWARPRPRPQRTTSGRDGDHWSTGSHAAPSKHKERCRLASSARLLSGGRRSPALPRIRPGSSDSGRPPRRLRGRPGWGRRSTRQALTRAGCRGSTRRSSHARTGCDAHVGSRSRSSARRGVRGSAGRKPRAIIHTASTISCRASGADRRLAPAESVPMTP